MEEKYRTYVRYFSSIVFYAAIIDWNLIVTNDIMISLKNLNLDLDELREEEGGKT